MARDPQHPRPQRQRAAWGLLDGPWAFALDPDAEVTAPGDVEFDRTLTVPFAPETPASGIAFDGFLRRCWYRRTIDVIPGPGERLVVHFQAVDREARVWANGHEVGHHVGGYTPFSVDVTDVRAPDGTVELVVRADDDPRTTTIPRGKQDWWPEPHLIWYPRTTGVWQSVWWELVPAAHVEALRWTGDPATMSVALEATVAGAVAAGDTLRVVLRAGERVLVDDSVAVTDVVDGRAHLRRTFGLGVAGVDDPFTLIWRPSHPALIEAEVTLAGAAASDTVASYTALRSIGVAHGRIVLNGQPVDLRLALDQGYWPDSGLTAPSVEALRRDVELVRELGLNGVRKHQKIEDPRWLAACDELGVLVWEELPSAYPFSADTAAALTREWLDVIERDRDHPCIIAWVPVNESWGVPGVARDPQQRALVEGLAALTRALDPTRLVSANDGWETTGGDLVGIHDYDQDADRLRARYASAAALADVFDGFGPARRVVTIDGEGAAGRALVLSEMGGSTLADDPGDLFGYGNLTDVEAYLDRVGGLCAAVLASPVLSGYCWTQLTDTYQEANGLLRMDRTPKADLAELRRALRGRRPSGSSSVPSSG